MSGVLKLGLLPGFILARSGSPNGLNNSVPGFISQRRQNTCPGRSAVPQAMRAGWTVLATAPNGSGTPYPYLLARRYGKGMIVPGGDDVRLSPAKMLENFMAHRDCEVRRDHQPTGDDS